jgi:toxin ParE1/3/4
MAHRRISYRPEAIREIEEAEKWYRGIDDRLGDRWLEEAGRTIESIRDHPELWAVDRSGVREVLVHHFPYIVAYRLHAEMIEIVAVAHASRRRGYWRRRLRKS